MHQKVCMRRMVNLVQSAASIVVVVKWVKVFMLRSITSSQLHESTEVSLLHATTSRLLLIKALNTCSFFTVLFHLKITNNWLLSSLKCRQLTHRLRTRFQVVGSSANWMLVRTIIREASMSSLNWMLVDIRVIVHRSCLSLCIVGIYLSNWKICVFRICARVGMRWL